MPSLTDISKQKCKAEAATPPRLRWLLDTSFSLAGIAGLAGLFQILGWIHPAFASMWMLASFGASITLILACPDSPLARPYPALVGNVGSALIGVLCWTFLKSQPEIAFVSAIVLSVGFMSLFKAWHPPGGATALIAVIGGESVHRLGFLFPIFPILIGTLWLLGLAVIRRKLEAWALAFWEMG